MSLFFFTTSVLFRVIMQTIIRVIMDLFRKILGPLKNTELILCKILQNRILWKKNHFKAGSHTFFLFFSFLKIGSCTNFFILNKTLHAFFQDRIFYKIFHIKPGLFTKPFCLCLKNRHFTKILHLQTEPVASLII